MVDIESNIHQVLKNQISYNYVMSAGYKSWSLSKYVKYDYLLAICLWKKYIEESIDICQDISSLL